MDTNDNLKRIVEYKKLKGSIRKPKYATRKLSIGLVSCMLGYALLVSPSSVEAAEDTTDVAVEETQDAPSGEEAPAEGEKEELPADAEAITNETPAPEVSENAPKADETPAPEANDITDEAQTEPKAETETPQENKDEFKLTEEEKTRLLDANYTRAEIEKIEAEGKEKAKEENFDRKAFIDEKVKAMEAKEETTAFEVSEDGADKKEAQKAAAEDEDTTVGKDANNAVHGYVGVQAGGDLNLVLGNATGQQFKPIEGVRVYFQWFEKWSSGKEYTSPVYSTTSGADGQFHIGIKPYLAPDGSLVQFDADTTVSAGTERYKMWVDESTIPEGYALQYITGEGVVFPGSSVPITQGGSGSDTTKNTHNNWKVLLRQLPKNMHKEATDTPVESKTGGNISGNVSWDYSSGVGGIHWQAVADKTSPAKDVNVKASYLSDYAMKKIFSNETATMLGVSSPSKIRGSGWTAALEQQLQEWINKEVAKDPDNWIAETVQAKTNAEGNYIIQFNGTWGPDRNYDAATTERTAGNTYDGWVGHKWTEDEVNRLGTIADDANLGTFATSGVNYWNRKHINDNWIYVSTEGTDNLRAMTPFNNNYYTYRNNCPSTTRS